MSSDQNELQPFKNLTPIWDSLPVCIMWQQYHRNSDRSSGDFPFITEKVQNIEEGINMSIILNAASMVEGYLEEKIRMLYEQRMRDQPDDFEMRQKENFFTQVEKATFEKYNDIYQIVTGKKLNEIIGNKHMELWKCIKYLFKLRNIVAHSQSLAMLIDLKRGSKTAAEVNFKGKFKEIISYLQERSLLANPIPEKMLFKTMFFGSQTADYFYERGKEFILCLDQGLCELGYLSHKRLNEIFREYEK